MTKQLGLITWVTLGFLGTAKADYLCSTYSNGRFYSESSYSENDGLSRVIEACQGDSSADYSQCIENAGCEENSSGGGGNGGGGGSFGAHVQLNKQYCGSDLCTYQVSWRTAHLPYSVLTVQIPGETEERLMACEGQFGSAQAPWIAKGKPYIFRVYETAFCSPYVGSYYSPVATAEAFELGNGGVSFIDGNLRSCNSSLCTFDINWRVAFGRGAVVTVVDEASGKEKLYACSEAQGSGVAPWIPADGRAVTFNLYASETCAANVGDHLRPVATKAIRR